MKLICASEFFKRLKIARAASQINSKLNERDRMIRISNDINMLKFAWRKYRKISLKAIFSYSGKLSSSSCTNDLLISELKPSLNENVGSEKLFLY